MVGIYKAVPPRANGTTSGQFRAVLVANNVKRMVRDAGALLASTHCDNAWLHAHEHQLLPAAECPLAACPCCAQMARNAHPFYQ